MSHEYLTMLHNRPKWQKTMRNLAIGDIVIITDETTHRDEWKMGRITDVTSADNHVRRVRIRKPDGNIVERDRTKVVHLELDGEAEPSRTASVAFLRSNLPTITIS